MSFPFDDLEGVNTAECVVAEKIIQLIWNLAAFKVGSLREPGCGQVECMRREVGRACLGAPGAVLRAL